jgi:hypothetical protein
VKGSNHFVKKSLLILGALAILTACGKKTGGDILSKQQMVKIMQELYIAEEKVNHLALSRDSSKLIANQLHSRVFENAALTDSIFKKSFDYYMERPQEMEMIYAALVDTLHLKEQRVPFRPDQAQ